ncbi:MAG: bifunctional UDP-N-acetylglucosamine diphosphorylase/glucosamine-1-phosphate N-acetyltransferase GlmU [Eubacteriales bacterium]
MAHCGIILAAGKGTRMKSNDPKVLCQLLFKPLVGWVMDASRKAGMEDLCVVTGHGRQQVMQALEGQCEFAVQEQQLGTGHAVMQCREFLRRHQGDTVVILSGDTPLIEAKTLAELCRQHEEQQASATVLAGRLDNPFGYGRILRDEQGNVTGIVEQKDATPAQQQVKEINSGIYAFQAEELLQTLDLLTNDNAQGEYYLTDTIGILVSQGKRVRAMVCEDSQQIMGINDRAQLYEAAQVAKERILTHWMKEGVTIYDKASTYIAPDAQIGPDTHIYPSTIIKAGVTIGEGCVIGPNTQLERMTIGSHTTVNASVASDSTIGDRVQVGPFAYIRPGSRIGNDIKVGDFVEVKNSTIGDGTKISHLTYIGDSDFGGGINVGCGTVTVNYDGKRKFRTVVEDHAFIGCNTNLVAPVTVREGAYIAAGSTITDEVPEKSLAIARARQINKTGWKKREE